MRYRKQIRVTYLIKNEDGFAIEKRLKFSTLTDAYVFIRLINHNSNLVGKPILEFK